MIHHTRGSYERNKKEPQLGLGLGLDYGLGLG